jgi:hypothetical protein
MTVATSVLGFIQLEVQMASEAASTREGRPAKTREPYQSSQLHAIPGDNL